MAEKLDPLALGYAAAIVSAAIMLLLSILGGIGIYAGGVKMMQQWHMLFSLSIGGIIWGMAEGAVIAFVLVYAFGWLYNKFS